MSNEADEDAVAKLAPILEYMRDTLSPEVISAMAEMTHRLGILTAIEESGSLAADTLAHVMYEQKNHVLSVSEMREIVVKKMPVLIYEGLVDENGLTELGRALARKHMEFLGMERPKFQ